MTDLSFEDRRWLDSAARLARSRLGTTGVFPAVAALVVEADGSILVGRGLTGPMGHPTALSAALADARGRTAGSTAYLTLEPESAGPHESEAQRLTSSGVARTVIGALDPDRTRRGAGTQVLREYGVDVIVANHAPSLRLIEGQAMRARHGRPFVTVSMAVSADEMIARRDVEAPVDLLSPAARRWLDFEESLVDAVMTSARWIAYRGDLWPASVADPRRRIVVAGPDATDPLDSDNGRKTIIVAAAGFQRAATGATVLPVAVHNRRLDLGDALRQLAGQGISTIRAEAGARLTEGLVSAELADRVEIFRSTVTVGRGGVPATPFGRIEARLRAAGFEQLDERPVGENLMQCFDRVL